jgi:hypothetical protein
MTADFGVNDKGIRRGGTMELGVDDEGVRRECETTLNSERDHAGFRRGRAGLVMSGVAMC